MIHFIAVIIIFLAPVNGKPGEMKMMGFEAHSIAECQEAVMVVKSELMQNPMVADVEVDCGAVPNRAEKAT